MNDFIVRNEGSIFMVTPVTPQAQGWVSLNLRLESWQWLGNSFSVGYRYIEDLVQGMRNDGFVVETGD